MKYLLSLLFVSAASLALSQNGKIIEQVPFTLPDSSIHKIEKIAPDIRTSLSAVNFYHITYLSDGFKVKGYLAIPKKEGKYPCIIYNRGGNRELGKISDEGFVQRGLAELCNEGYIIAGSQYRGNDGGEGKEEFGGKDVNDVLNLIPLFSHIQQADTSRIGMFGWSRGGMMTYLTLARTDLIKAAVVGSGMADAFITIEKRPEMGTNVYAQLVPDYSKNKAQALKERSAVYWADRINKTTPLLLLHGSADWRVSPEEAFKMVDALYKVKHPFRFILYEGGQHSLIEYRSDYKKQIIEWFNFYLKERKPWPSIEPHGD